MRILLICLIIFTAFRALAYEYEYAAINSNTTLEVSVNNSTVLEITRAECNTTINNFNKTLGDCEENKHCLDYQMLEGIKARYEEFITQMDSLGIL